MRIPVLLALLGVAASPVAVSAAWAGPADLMACRAIADDAGRLACYDAATAHMDQRAVAPDAPRPHVKAQPPAEAVAPAEAETETRIEDSFGAEDLIRREERAEKGPGELASTVASIEYSLLKKAIITFENGQVWRQLDSDGANVRANRSVGKPVVVREARFGSYLMSIDEGRSVRVKRIQ